jgi:hypothetical protein
MQLLQRTALVLIWPAIACLGAACDGKDAPTETSAPAGAASFSGTSAEEGGKFLLGGTAHLDEDPENPANDAIEIRTDIPPYFGTVSRTVNVKIDKLDNMLEFKAWFYSGVGVGVKSCFDGSPRLQLAIDLDGDGDSDGNAMGYFGPSSANFTGCPPNTWLYEDFTGGDGITGLGLFPSPPQTTPNEETEWDLREFACDASPLPAGLPGGLPADPCIDHPGAAITWSAVELAIAAFSNHLVCTVALVDGKKTDQPPPPPRGAAYYDLFSAGTATWTDRSDIGGRGFAKGCAMADHEDDEHVGDHDMDHDHDDDDDRFDHDRRERWKD